MTRNFQIVPLRIFGMSLVLGWIWVFLFGANDIPTSSPHLPLFLIGSFFGLVMLSLLRVETIQTHIKTYGLSVTIGFVAALYILFNVTLFGTLERNIDVIAQSLAWFIVGFSGATLVAHWLWLYTKWIVDNASFFTLVSFLLSSLVYGIVFILIPPAAVLIVSLIPLASFVLFLLSIREKESAQRENHESIREAFPALKLNIAMLFIYGIVCGYLYFAWSNTAYDFNSFSLLGIALAGLVAFFVLWLHCSRRRGLSTMEWFVLILYGFCLIGPSFLPETYYGFFIVAHRSGTAFLFMLSIVFLIDTSRELTLSTWKVCLPVLGSLSLGALGGFYLGQAIAHPNMLIPASIVGFVFLLLLLIAYGIVSLSGITWIGGRPSDVPDTGKISQEVNGLDILPEFKKRLSTAYVTQPVNDLTIDMLDGDNAIKRKPFWKETCLKLAKVGQLSPREQEVFLLIAKGRSIKRISEDLFISPHTTRVHTARIYKKLRVHSNQELLDLVEQEIASGFSQTQKSG